MNIPIKTFARRISRGFTEKQQMLFDNLLPIIKVDKLTDWETLRANYKEVFLEIGFGNGDFAVHQAYAHPDTLYIGAEPFLDGVARLLDRIHEQSISNIRILPDDVRIILEAMPSNYLDKVFIICPDPWPKRRHHKRRLVQQGFLDTLAQSLKANGVIEIVTDHLCYAQWVLKEARKCEALSIQEGNLSAFTELPSEWLYTKYQKRGLKMGCAIHRFLLHKKK